MIEVAFILRISRFLACMVSLLLAAQASANGLVPRLLDRPHPQEEQQRGPAPDAASRPFPGLVVGRVVRVVDGDTIHIEDETKQTRIIRLTDIDAPETGHGRHQPGQPFSKRSKQHLSGLVDGNAVVAECHDRQQYGGTNGAPARERLICRVWLGVTDINLTMIAAGMAFANREKPTYVRDARAYRLEEEARAAKRGLWVQTEPTPPWVWRKDCWKLQVCPAADQEN